MPLGEHRIHGILLLGQLMLKLVLIPFFFKQACGQLRNCLSTLEGDARDSYEEVKRRYYARNHRIQFLFRDVHFVTTQPTAIRF